MCTDLTKCPLKKQQQNIHLINCKYEITLQLIKFKFNTLDVHFTISLFIVYRPIVLSVKLLKVFCYTLFRAN